MQTFSCPFCGSRPEYEFHFGGDAGNERPEGFATVAAPVWAEYLHFRNNPKGDTQEVWLHMTCGELFVMDRNTVTMAAGPGQPILPPKVTP
ncbi:sarcosine oxidase subunit delta [Pseudotabrizicola sp. 4114]|uniref:sarcosine oxidase subunit delta n=1 Tax=Pseudotabrizicola sp. 4114 TaxID=2817731 RepID=UPI00285C398A|nr:sarcosine oxidase subunit delta [Pseudorhodobacter sp. 4114]